MVRVLPIVELEIDGELRKYFADERLRQYRAVDNPHDAVYPEDVSGTMAEVIAECRVEEEATA